MKSLLMAAALVTALAGPALAEDAASPAPPPQAQAALAPSQEGTVPAQLPRSETVEVIPMSVQLESNSPPPSRGGGCHHDKTTVYLTN